MIWRASLLQLIIPGDVHQRKPPFILFDKLFKPSSSRLCKYGILQVCGFHLVLHNTELFTGSMLPFWLFAFQFCSREIYGVCSFHSYQFRPASLSRRWATTNKIWRPFISKSPNSCTVRLLLSWLLKRGKGSNVELEFCHRWGDYCSYRKCGFIPIVKPSMRLYLLSPCCPYHPAEYIFRPKRELQFDHPPSVVLLQCL